MNKVLKGIISCIVILCLVYVGLRYISFNDTAVTIAPKYAKEVLIKHNILGDNVSDDNFVTRADCLIYVMNIIGANEEMNECYKNIDWYSIGFFRNFYDEGYEEDLYYLKEEYYNDLIGYCLMSQTDFGECSDKNENESQIKEYRDLASIEMTSDQIAYGKKVDKTWRMFKGDENVKLNEAIAFIVRCLEPSTTNKYLMYKEALKKGIISKKDSFYTLLGENKLQYKDLYTLLYRLMNSKRYKYIEYVSDSSDDLGRDGEMWYPNIDKVESITYIEWLEQMSLEHKEYSKKVNPPQFN